MQKKLFNVRLSIDLINEIKEVAEMMGVSLSHLVREALKDKLKSLKNSSQST